MTKQKYAKNLLITKGPWKGYYCQLMRIYNPGGTKLFQVRVNATFQTTDLTEDQFIPIKDSNYEEVSEQERDFEKFSPIFIAGGENGSNSIPAEAREVSWTEGKEGSDYGSRLERKSDYIEPDYRAGLQVSRSPKGTNKTSSGSQKRSSFTKLEANKFELLNNYNKMNLVSPGIIHDKLAKPVEDLMNILALDYDHTSINNHIVRLENAINSRAFSSVPISDYKTLTAAYFFIHLNNLGVNIPIQPWMSQGMITGNDNPRFIATALNKKGYTVDKANFDVYLERLLSALEVTIIPAQKRIPVVYSPRKTLLVKTRKTQQFMRFPLMDVSPVRENVIRIIALDIDKKIADIQQQPANSKQVRSVIILNSYKEEIGPSNKLIRYAKNNPGSLEAKLILPFHEKYLALLANAQEDFYEKPAQTAAVLPVDVEVEGIKVQVLEKEVARLQNGLNTMHFTPEEQSVLDYIIKNNQKIAQMNNKTIRNLKTSAITYEGIAKLRAQAIVEFNKRIGNLFLKNLNDYKININLIRPRPRI